MSELAILLFRDHFLMSSNNENFIIFVALSHRFSALLLSSVTPLRDDRRKASKVSSLRDDRGKASKMETIEQPEEQNSAVADAKCADGETETEEDQRVVADDEAEVADSQILKDERWDSYLENPIPPICWDDLLREKKMSETRRNNVQIKALF